MTGNDIKGYLVRSTSDGSVEVRISEAAVRGISVEVMRGFGVTRRRGTEIGGLLIGTVSKGLFVIDEFEIVPCEYAYGPSYLLSENDAPGFAGAVERWRGAPRVEKYAIGWFRSHTREGLRPDAPDLEVFHRHFGSVPATLLLIKPYATHTSEAALFLPNNGRLVPEPAMEFAFAAASPEPARSEAESPTPSRTLRERPPAPSVAEEPEPVLPASPPAPSENRPVLLPRLPTEKERILQEVLGPRDKRDGRPLPLDRDLFADYAPKPASPWVRVLSWSVFVLAAMVFGFANGYRQAGGNLTSLLPWTAPAAVRDAYALGLTARLRGDSILVQWIRDARAAVLSERGRVIITSANGRHEIPLDASELHSGIVLFKTDAEEATIRLEVFLTPDRQVVEQTTWKRSAAQQQ